jgi:hypothetical protein
VLASCTTERTEPLLQAAPPPLGHAIMVDAFVPAEPAWERLARRLRSQLTDELSRTGEIALITAQPRAAPAPKTLVLSGYLVAVDEGSEAARFLIGMGLGSPSLRARVRVVDAGGQPVLEFDQMRTPEAASGFAAHWDPIDMDNEIDALAAAAAATIARWLIGETL